MTVKYTRTTTLVPALKVTAVGDWTDLCLAEDAVLDPGEFRPVSLGIRMQLPKGFEAWVLPRSSTGKRKKVLMYNSMGIIDESYCGPNDIWHALFYAPMGAVLMEGERDVRRHKVSFMEGLDLTGLPIVAFRNNGHKFNFVLDTGSYNSVINKSVLDRLDHVKSPHKADLVGIDGIKRDGQEIIQAEIQYKDKSIHANFIVSDLDDIFKEIKAEGKIKKDYEGCLSVPTIYGMVPRPTKARIKAKLEDGSEVRIKATGELARILLHEIDHLDGILFIDHIKGVKDAFYEMDAKGNLIPVDYDTKIANNKKLWGEE